METLITLSQDIPSGEYAGSGKSRKQILYGKKGDEVRVITQHDHVLIVENTKTKNRYPVTKDELWQEKPTATK